MIISLKKDWHYAFNECLKQLKQNKIIIYPTDTVYGIGGNALNENVKINIARIKKRDPKKPFSVLVGDLYMLEKFFYIDKYKEILMSYLPGPYTFIIKSKYNNKPTGVRIPDSYFIRKLSISLGMPIITTSANISGTSAPKCIKDINIKEDILTVDGGCKNGNPSTVVDLINKKIIRKTIYEFTFPQ